MDNDLLKLLGEAGAQLILAAGYIPAFWLIRALWTARDSLQLKFIEMLTLKFADAVNAKELWAAQAKVIEDQTRATAELGRIVEGLEKRVETLERRVGELFDDVRRARP